MKACDYEKLLSFKDYFLGTDLYLQLENTKEWPLFFSKLRLNNSTYVEAEDAGRVMHNGIYIDIMCLSVGYDNRLLRYTQYLSAKVLSAAALTSRDYRTNSLLKKFFLFFSSLVCRTALKQLLLHHVRCCSSLFSSGKYLTHFFGRAPFAKACIPSYILSQSSNIDFEGYSFPCALYLSDYLSLRFGPQWHMLPSDDVINSFPSHCMRFIPHPNILEPL